MAKKYYVHLSGGVRAFTTKKEAFRQARNWASAAYESALRLGVPRDVAKKQSQIFVTCEGGR